MLIKERASVEQAIKTGRFLDSITSEAKTTDYSMALEAFKNLDYLVKEALRIDAPTT